MHTTSPEPRHLRSCLSRFVTGVAVVSYLADGEPRGVTVNSFTSVSMDPPLILVSLARTAKAACHLSEVPFTINVLKASQFDIAMQFAGLRRTTCGWPGRPPPTAWPRYSRALWRHSGAAPAGLRRR